MPRRLSFDVEFAMTYEVEQLDRIDRSGGRRTFEYPDATPIHPQQELAEGPIISATPDSGDAWVGVFNGAQYGSPSAASGRLIAWPYGRSFCVVYAGGGVVVRSDDPSQTYEIDVFPVTGAFVVADRGVVLFADFTSLAAYNGDGLLWRSRRLALDDLRVEGVEGDTLRVAGLFGSGIERFTVDLATGEASGQPFQPPE